MTDKMEVGGKKWVTTPGWPGDGPGNTVFGQFLNNQSVVVVTT